MALSEEAYKALEDTVGSEYISREPAVLDGYCFVWGNELESEDKFSTRPLAVILPGCTEEVQGIVRVANRFGLQYRAHATGFEVVALTAPNPILCVDMRRMNGLEIDEKNRIAVVEAYVSQRRLQMELSRRGLRCNQLGAGPSASVMTGTACHMGSGVSSISTEYGGRNLLGVEWVLPDGEILKLGSLGSGAGWINGDGPGPSLRGALRGYGGANGGNGIFTKIATKVYPWYGPPEMKVIGEGPLYEMEVPENYRVLAYGFAEAGDLAQFLHQFYEESIGFSLQLLPTGFHLTLATKSNDEVYALYKSIPKEMIDALGIYGMLLSYDASSQREMGYKDKVLQKIADNSNAIPFPLDETATRVLYNETITAQGTVKAVFRACGTFIISPVGEETWDSMVKMSRMSWKELMRPLEEEGSLLGGVGQEAMWGVPFGDGCGHVEMLSQWDPTDNKANRAVAEMVRKGNEKIAEWKLGINSLENALSYNEGALKGAAPHLSVDFIKYMKRIKKAFDPGNTSEPAWYVSPDESAYKVGKD